MGARHAEFGFGLWMLVAPWLFGHAQDRPALLAHDLVVAALLLLVPLLCYHRALERLHLLLLPVAAWTIGFGWWHARTDPLPAFQNHVLLGMCVLMTAIIPSRATEPPRAWRD